MMIRKAILNKIKGSYVLHLMSLEKHRREDKTQEQTVCNYFPPVLSQPSMKPHILPGFLPKEVNTSITLINKEFHSSANQFDFL